MKVLSVFVVTLCFAAASASFKGIALSKGAGKYGGGFNKFGKQAYGLGVGVNDAAKAAHAANAFKAGGGQFGALATDYGKAAGQGFGKHLANKHAFGANKGAYNAGAAGKHAAAANSGHKSGYAGNFAAKGGATKAGYGNQFAKKAGFNKGGVLGNNVNYAFDKNFNRNAAETGGFVLEENSNKHALDDLRNRQSRFGLGKNAYGANKGAAFGAQNAAAASGANGFGKKGYNAGNYGKNAFNHHNNAGRLHAAGSNLLSNAGANKFHANAQDAALHKANNYAGKDALFGRNAAQAGFGGGQHAFRNNAGKFGGLGGLGGYGGYGGYGKGYGKGYGAGVGQGGFAGKGYGHKGSLFNKGINHLAAANGAYGAALGSLHRNKGQAGYLNAKNAFGNDKGFYQAGNNKAGANGYGANALGANGYNGFSKGAKAGHAGYGKAAAAGFGSHLKKLDAANLKRVLSNRKANRRVLKKFFTKKNVGGGNRERMLFNNKHYNKAFGNQVAAGGNAGNKFGAANFLAKHNAAAANNFGQKAANNYNAYNKNAGNAAANGFGSNVGSAFGQNNGYGQGYGRNIGKGAYNNHKAGFGNAQNAARLYHKNNYGQGAGGYGNHGYGSRAALGAARGFGYGGLVGGGLGYGGLGYGGLGYGGLGYGGKGYLG